MYETIRIVEKLKPKYVVWENVKNLLSNKHRHNFDAYLQTMKQLGYNNYYQVLNAKDYGIPQNRERVFTVSILGNEKYDFPKGNECDNKIDIVGNYMPSGHEAGRIVNENGLAPTVKENHGTVTAVAINFEFPPKQSLKLRLKDLLDKEVDEKYYLSDTQVNRIKTSSFMQEQKRIQEKDWCDTMQGGWRQPYIQIKNATKQGYLEAHDGDGCYITNIDKKRGTVQKEMIPTLKTSPDIGVVVKENKDDLINWLENEREYCREMQFECCVEELDKVIDRINSYV